MKHIFSMTESILQYEITNEGTKYKYYDSTIKINLIKKKTSYALLWTRQ